MSVKEFGETSAIAPLSRSGSTPISGISNVATCEPTPARFFLHVDEFQLLTTSYDSSFASTCRSSRVSFFVLTQSLPTVYAALGGGDKAKSEVSSLFGNMNLKIFCAQQRSGDEPMGCRHMLGRRRQFLVNASNRNSDPSSPSVEGMFSSQMSAGVSETMEYQMQPAEFSNLRMGRPAK